MEKNNKLNSNQLLLLQKCEKHLSTFGLKVMTTLMQLKNEGHNKKNHLNQSKQFQSQNKRLLKFNESNVYVTPLTMNVETTNEGNNNIPVATSLDLLKTNDFNKDMSVRNEISEYIAPTISDNTLELTSPHQYSNQANESLNEKSEPTKAIPWNDIFDSEIFKEIYDSDDDTNKSIQKNNFNRFYMEFPSNESKVQQESNHVDICDPEKKRKNKTKVAELSTKKTKTSEQNKPITKNIFRKEKYKTTVKNWLNCVDPNNGVEPDTRDQVYGNESDCNTRKARIDYETSPNKDKNSNEPVIKHKSNKKVVQARLANKDGKMKFKKPIKDADVTKVIENCDAKSSNEKEKLMISKHSKAKKDKKIAKFVAPIKSQLPVKDLAYNVILVNDNSFTEHRSTLDSISNCEIVTILMYSNGYSQLNSQHTDVNCVSEGILLYVDDIFYYLQGYINGCDETLRKIFSDNVLTCYEAKELIIYLKCHFKLSFTALNVIDVKIGSSLLSPDNPPECFSDVQKLLDFTPSFTIATDCSLQKAAWYSTLLKESSAKLRVMLVENGLWKVFEDIEMKILLIVADMQHLGVAVDLDELKSMENILMIRMKEIESECYRAAGKTFQINSSLQVRTILYDELKLDTKSNVKIRETISRGAKSTAEAMLRSLTTVHPLPKLILEYRHLHKAHATFLVGLAQHVRDGVVKPTWDQTAAATGRIASNNPNLQAIPKKPFDLFLFPSGGDDARRRVCLRRAVRARRARRLLAADFRHVECRVLARRAHDERLRRALAQPDLFRHLALLWSREAQSEVSAELRERTKRLVYASVYGAGTRKLMEILDVDYERALSIMTSFNSTFPSLKNFSKSIVAECEKRDGRLTLASGRARTFRDISSSNSADKSHAERQAVNFIIQGTAADLCKTAMILTMDKLRNADPPIDGHLILQIHDELVWEVPEEHLDRAAAIIKTTMENCGRECGMDVVLPVAMYCGKSWGEMEEFVPKEIV